MRSEELEILIEDWNNNTVLRLRGRFRKEQIPNLREKFQDLLDSGSRSFIIDFTEVIEIDESIDAFLIEMLNLAKGKGGEIRIVCNNQAILEKLGNGRHLFDILPSFERLSSGSLIKRLQARGITLSKRTGVRLSRPVAVILMIALIGWFLSLLGILVIQYNQVQRQKKELKSLRQWKREASKKIDVLGERLKPLEDLGVLKNQPGRKKRQ